MAVSYIPRGNRYLGWNKMQDAALHPWRQLTLAVGQTNEKDWWGGEDKREASGLRYQPHTSDGVMG